MEDDILDFENLDYGDLGEFDAADVDIENLERELGLLDDGAQQTTAAQVTEEKTAKEPVKDDVKEKDKEISSTPAQVEEPVKTTATTQDDASKEKPAVSKPTSTQKSTGPTKHAPMQKSAAVSPSSQKDMQWSPPAHRQPSFTPTMMPPMFHAQRFPFAQGMMGMKYVSVL